MLGTGVFWLAAVAAAEEPPRRGEASGDARLEAAFWEAGPRVSAAATSVGPSRSGTRTPGGRGGG